jgi:hypothetical protein
MLFQANYDHNNTRTIKTITMNNTCFSLHEAKEIDVVDYLEKLGYRPQKKRNRDYWYLSPLRDEKTASFKVNRNINRWYDFGMGQGGNLIDFGKLYHPCNVSELLVKLQQFFSFHPQTLTVQQPLQNAQIRRQKALEPAIKVIAAKPLTHPALCLYLDARKIPFETAEKYCKEVEFELYDKPYFAIGFENNSGGFELRNERFKGSSSPKDITLLKGDKGSQNVTVFEGFFSFLSYQTLFTNQPYQLTNFLVLNSLSFFEKSRQLMEKYDQVHLYLDRHLAGKKHTLEALRWDKKYVDQSHLYKQHKDLNDFLISQSRQVRQSQLLRKHL